MKRMILVLAALLLAGCSSVCIFCNSSLYPLPNVGQWVTYGGNEPSVNNNSFAFPADGGKTIIGYVYTQLSAVPKAGQTLTLNYSVSGNNPVWVSADKTDTVPPTMHLFLWRKGDNLGCAGAYNFYRLFADRTPLVLGDTQIMSTTLDSTNWIGCYGAVDAASFAGTLANLAGAGFTFGGQYFAGHGIYLSGGSATFKINSFNVK
jgi:hypothetical protein